MIESGDIKNIPKIWQKDFDLQSNEKHSDDQDQTATNHVLHDFITENKKHFNEIEHFMHELNFWIEEQIGNYQSSQTVTSSNT